ncbi:metallophosphoesterase [Eubacterium ramulus]
MKYYISDLHLFHENAIKFDHRPFASIQEMHEVILKNWNDRVTNGDFVYILGDVSLRGKNEDLIAFVACLKGRKVLIRGNHDDVSDYRYQQLFTEICDYKEIYDSIGKENVIQTEAEAKDTVYTIVKQLLSGSRPLSERQYALVHAFVCDDVCDLPDIASKNTLIRLLINTKKLTLADRLNLSDVMILVDELNYCNYNNSNPKKLNLKNQDRKFLTAVLDRIFQSGKCDIRT